MSKMSLIPPAYVCMFSDLSKGFGGFKHVRLLAVCPCSTSHRLNTSLFHRGVCLDAEVAATARLPPHLRKH